MELGKYRFSYQVTTLLLGMGLLAGSANPAFAFGHKPSDPSADPAPAPAPKPTPAPSPQPSLQVSNPQAGAVLFVGKSINVMGVAQNVARVRLLLDGTLLASEAATNFGLVATFTAAHVGKHKLSVVGYDSAGKEIARTDYSVEIRAGGTSLAVENVAENQSFTEDDNALFYIVASADVDAVEVSRNGKVVGQASYVADLKKYKFSSILTDTGTFDFKFSGKAAGKEMISKTVRVSVVAKNTPPPTSSKNFNAYILKAIDQINSSYALLGYNINSVYTHNVDYGGKGTLKATNGALTMCVAASLEVIVTAFEIYAKETGDRSVFDFLPFSSWNTLASTSIKAQIWVDAALDSYGTADAISHFGMGELVPFSELTPGSFVNINRDNGTGHSVIFISYIDINAKELDHYDANKVAGFKYFSAQGKEARGQGGFDYRYAFFSKNGCPTIPYHRDCGLMYSSSRKLLNTGVMWSPSQWRKPAGSKAMAAPLAPSAADIQLTHRPAQFNGLTTDD